MDRVRCFCVRFNMLKNEYIYIEHNLYHYNKDKAVECAKYIISKALDIHPDRLTLVSVTEEGM